MKTDQIKTIQCRGCGKAFEAPANSIRSLCALCTGKRMIELAGTRPNADKPAK